MQVRHPGHRLGKGRGGEGEWEWMSTVDREPWGSGWDTSGILHVFVPHLGYCYFPPFSHHGAILGPLLTPAQYTNSLQFLSQSWPRQGID